MADKNSPREEHESTEADAHKTVQPEEDVKQETQETADEVAPIDAPVKPAPEVAGASAVPGKKSKFAWLKTKNGKITLASVAGVILLIAVLLAVPATRYGILGSFIRKDVSLSIIDSKTGKPVSDAEVSVPGTTGKTDNEGKAKLGNVPVGQYQLSVKKKNYKDASVAFTVPVLANADAGQLKLEATGRQVPITVTNKITGQPLQKVTITAGEATAITDAKGEVTLVVPANATTVKATLKATGYNDQAIDITVTEQKDAKNAFTMTAAGKVYFLSKRTGKINVMKSDLDGSNAQVVVQGTGKEEEGNTVLLASRDWKYLLLQSRRDSDKAKLYLITTSNDQLTTVDEGNANFTLTGWNNHTFVYSVQRLSVKNWQPKQQALKSYDAEANKLLTLDETGAEGTSDFDYSQEGIRNVILLDNQNVVVYTKSWGGYKSKPTVIASVQPNGSNKKTLKTFDTGTDLSTAIPYKSGEIYFSVFPPGENKTHIFEYDGAVKENTSVKEDVLAQFYPTYLLSPSGEKTFWYEPRDGKNTLQIGDKNGENGKEVASLSEYTPYGWYTDDYLLASKGGSELYILPTSKPDQEKPLKVTDYHKPNIVYRGYGGGYGGGF